MTTTTRKKKVAAPTTTAKVQAPRVRTTVKRKVSTPVEKQDKKESFFARFIAENSPKARATARKVAEKSRRLFEKVTRAYRPAKT